MTDTMTDTETENFSDKPPHLDRKISRDGVKGAPDSAAVQEDDHAANYPQGAKLVLIIASLCLSVFLVALDQTIIAPALGAITAQFR
jgi:hypothetical protein